MQHRYAELCNEGCEVSGSVATSSERFVVFLPHSVRRDCFLFHDHGNQFLKQIENKQPVQMSFSMCFAEIAVSLFREAGENLFGMYKCIQSEMCADGRIFHLKDRRLKRGQAWFRNINRNNSRTAWLFPSVRWSKSRIVSDGLCV